MIRILKSYFEFSDKRGKFSGLINKGRWEEINIITSKKGSVRGNHYHRRIREIFIILEGEIDVVVEKVLKNGKLSGKIEKYRFKKGDVFLIDKYINHIFYVKKNAKWLNVLSHRITKNKIDIWRVK
ncbi:MAG: cupin domain-containing protein [Elusimicrobiota bacterium]